jgi:hypothetical protein
MSCRTGVLIFCILVLQGFLTPSPGITSALAGDPKTNLLADPLPPGAVSRIGRLRYGGMGRIGYLGVLPDSKQVLTLSSGAWRVWDLANDKQIHTVNCPSRRPQALSCDGLRFATLARLMQI